MERRRQRTRGARDQTLLVERWRAQLEEQVPHPLDGGSDHLPKLVRLGTQIRVVEPRRERLRADVRRAHDLDHEHGFVAHPHVASVGRDQSILDPKGTAVPQRLAMCTFHAFAIGLVDPVGPQVRVPPPFDRETEHRFDLRAREDVRRRLVVRVDVEDRGDPLDEVAVGLVCLAKALGERGRSRDVTHSLYPNRRSSSLRSASSCSVSTPSGEEPSITPSTPLPCSVWPTTISSGFAVAQ